jgi:hypothetical protein
MKGTNDKSNLVYLTLKEHYFAHLILVYAYPNVKRLKYGLSLMIGTMKHKGGSSRQFEIARKNITIYKPPSKQELKKEYKKALDEKRADLLHQQYGVSQTTIRKWLDMYNIKNKKPSNTEIKNAYDEYGMKYGAKHLGIGENTFRRRLEKMKVWRNTIPQKPPTDVLMKVYTEYGVVPGARFLGVYPQLFLKWIKEDGVWRTKKHTEKKPAISQAGSL